MRPWIKRIGLGLVTTLLAVVVIAAAYYAFVVHPDDRRIAMPQAEDIQPFVSRLDVVSTLFSTPWRLESSLPKEDFRAARVAFKNAVRGGFMSWSRRFESSLQVYVPTGDYPQRLEAFDGIFIPVGHTLKTWAPLTGDHSLRFAAYADGQHAKLTLRYGGAVVSETVLKQPVDAAPDRGFIYRQFGRFFWPDRDADIRRWRFVEAHVVLKPDEPLAFTCTDAKFGCVISDVRALKPTSMPARRNVLMILVDTMRGDAIDGGNAPQIAGVAAQGTTFSNALSPGNMTSPSTNALLSCRKAASLGTLAFAYAVNKTYRESHYGRGRPSFPNAFRRAGYATAMIGNVSVISEIYGVGINHGFEQQIAIEVDAYDTPMITRATEEWLAARGAEPFFLYVHLHGPHAPYRAPWRDIFATFPGWQAFGSYPSLLRWLYQSEIHYTDRYLAQILATVDRLGLTTDTDVVITADHGDMHTVHHFNGNEAAPDFAGAYFDHGATLLNDEVRVPMIFRGAGIKQEQVIDQFVSTLDIGPTLLERAGLEVPTYCEGTSFAARLRGEAASEAVPATIGTEAFQGRAIVFASRYKYIRMYTPVDKRVYTADSYVGPKKMFHKKEQLYDLTVDPGETVDLTGRAPELLAQARAAYSAFFNIGEIFELVVEVPPGRPLPIEIQVPDGAVPTVTLGKMRRNHLADGDTLLASEDLQRVMVELRGLTSALPTIRVDGVDVTLTMTAMKLPMTVPPLSFPLEAGGVDSLLPAGDDPSAFLRRVEDDGQKDRRISVGNPAFNKILREWGYLND